MAGLPTIEIEGKRFVLLEEAEYRRLCRRAGERIESEALPELPQPDGNGRYPAVQFARVSLARDLIRYRTELGLTRRQLADLAGVRLETVSRLEGARHRVQPRTVDKLMDAIESEQRKRSQTQR